MSLLNFPPEVTLQFLQKINLFQRINVCMTHPRLFGCHSKKPLCFDFTLDIKSKATISLKELQQLYQQSRTEKERDLCFDPKILDRLRTNFNEFVYMDMVPENNKFFANQKILQSFKGQIVIESEKDKFSDDFYSHFLSLISRMEGNLLLIFVDLEAFNNNYAEQFAQTLSRKLNRGEKVFCIDFDSQDKPVHEDFHAFPFRRHGNHGQEIQQCMTEPFTIYYILISGVGKRGHYLRLCKEHCGANAATLIGMISGDRFIEPKQHLVRGLRTFDTQNIFCDNCPARQETMGNSIHSYKEEPAYSNCDGCRFK